MPDLVAITIAARLCECCGRVELLFFDQDEECILVLPIDDAEWERLVIDVATQQRARTGEAAPLHAH